MVKSIIPMAAAKVDADKIPWNDPNWVAERKYDGSRYLMYVNFGTDFDGHFPINFFRSRQVSKKTGETVDKTDNVPHLSHFHFADGRFTFILDGEIITDVNGTSSQVTSVMGALPEKAIQRQDEQGYVHYVVFDILEVNGKPTTHLSYKERRQLLEGIYKQYLSYSPYILLAEIRTEGKEDWYEYIVSQGGEGVILKNLNMSYVAAEVGGKEFRNKNTWIKVKKYDTYDVVVMGYTEPTKFYTGKHLENWPYFSQGEAVTRDYAMGWIGAIRFGQYKDGKMVEIGQTDGMADDNKQYFTDHKDELIGTVIEIGGMEQIKDTGAIRHPRFLRRRPDKNPEQCILGVN